MTGAYPARLIARSAYMSRASSRRLNKTTVLAMHCAIKLLLSFLHIKPPAKEPPISTANSNFIKKRIYCQAQFAEFRMRPSFTWTCNQLFERCLY